MCPRICETDHLAATDRDIAVTAACVHFNRVLPGCRRPARVQRVVQLSVAGVEVEPRCDPVRDCDFHFAASEVSHRSTTMSPFAALTRRSPVTSPTSVAPLEFLITAEPPALPTRT